MVTECQIALSSGSSILSSARVFFLTMGFACLLLWNKEDERKRRVKQLLPIVFTVTPSVPKWKAAILLLVLMSVKLQSPSGTSGWWGGVRSRSNLMFHKWFTVQPGKLMLGKKTDILVFVFTHRASLDYSPKFSIGIAVQDGGAIAQWQVYWLASSIKRVN